MSSELPQPLVGYTTADAARVLGIAIKTLRRAISEGRAKTVSFGARKLVEPRELKRLSGEGLPYSKHIRIKAIRQPADGRQFYLASELARELGVYESTVSRWIKRGCIKTEMRAGSRVVLVEEAMWFSREKLLRRCRDDVKPPPTIVGYRLAEACRLLGVSGKALQRALVRGAARAVAIDGVKIVPPEEMRRLVAEGLKPRVNPGPRRRDPTTGRFLKGASP